jgi:thioredoxin 2
MSTSREHNSIAVCPACRRRNRIPAIARGVPRCASCHRPLPWLVEADDDSFTAAVTGSLPVLVDLWAPWCGPCRLVGPAVEQSASDFAGRLKVVKVNVDEAPTVVRRLGVQGVPTLILTHQGTVLDRKVGALPAAELSGWLDGALPVSA